MQTLFSFRPFFPYTLIPALRVKGLKTTNAGCSLPGLLFLSEFARQNSFLEKKAA
jgi:hypothetical protein